jgi:hypothetical protein
VLVSAVPDLGSNRATLVEVHTHALFLGTLTSEDVSRDGLIDLGLTEKNLLLSLGLGCLDLDDLATRNHADVQQSDLNGVVRQNHANKASVEAAHAANVVLGGPGLN